MDWVGLSAYGVGGCVGGVAGWLTARQFPRWRFELRTGLFAAGVLLASAVVVPRVSARAARAELRATGMELFGDGASADHYAHRLLLIRRDDTLADKAQVVAARLSSRIPSHSGLAVLGYAGMARLSLAELETSFAIRRRLAETSPVVCAGLWKGGLAPADLAAALRRLPPDDKRSWIDITARATTLELAAAAPPPPISNAQAAIAWSTLLGRLPEPRRAAIERASKSAAPISASDACEAFNVVAAEVPQLAPDVRETLLRVITSPFLVGG